ncbi:hypothetical protein [Paenibacillus alkalitolerans]|uniref:hypothetical protein n=1 Tax=Paenibacillus alkalitolerans TaxID=2799335 RepID=UPI001F46CE4A|nr:hypothetical protein [Paenibacillus alkalitolerans]
MSNGVSLLRDERGGAHVLLFGLMAVIFSVALFVVSLDWMLQSANKTKTKLVLDRAAHAAAINIDPMEAAYGRLVWDQAAGTADFYKYLHMNMRLDSQGKPQTGSYLTEAPVVHMLQFVSAPSYPVVLHQSVVVRAGTAEETVRNVDVTVYGPSVIAVVEVHHRVTGTGRVEPIVLSSVASVRFR